MPAPAIKLRSQFEAGVAGLRSPGQTYSTSWLPPARPLNLSLVLLSPPLPSLLAGGLAFAKPMREKLYMTLLDPFQVRYGRAVAAAMGLISVWVELLWIPSTLASLGVFARHWNS